MVFGGDWIKDFIREARGPVNETIQQSLKDAESSAREIVDDTLPKVGQLVARTVNDVEDRAQRIVNESLKQTYAYLDQALATTERRLSASIAVAGEELRGASSDAILQLERAIARTIERLEQVSVERVERAIQGSLEGSAKATRLEMQTLIASLGRVLLGSFLPLPALVFIWLARTGSSWSTPSIVGVALGLLAASAVAVAYVSAGPLARRSFEGDEASPNFTAMLAGYLPFVVMGSVMAAALVLGQ